MANSIDNIMGTAKTPSSPELRAAFDLLAAVAEAIRAAGEVPSGHLYALLCSKVSLEGYEKILGILVRAGLVEKASNHMLRWIGPAIEAG